MSPVAFAAVCAHTARWRGTAGRVNIVFLDGHAEPLAGNYVGCGIGFVEHGDVRWRVPGSNWDSAQH